MPRKKWNTNFKRGPLVPKLPKTGFGEHINRSIGWHLSQGKRLANRRTRSKSGFRYDDIPQEVDNAPWWVYVISYGLPVLIYILFRCSK